MSGGIFGNIFGSNASSQAGSASASSNSASAADGGLSEDSLDPITPSQRSTVFDAPADPWIENERPLLQPRIPVEEDRIVRPRGGGGFLDFPDPDGGNDRRPRGGGGNRPERPVPEGYIASNITGSGNHGLDGLEGLGIRHGGGRIQLPGTGDDGPARRPRGGGGHSPNQGTITTPGDLPETGNDRRPRGGGGNRPERPKPGDNITQVAGLGTSHLDELFPDSGEERRPRGGGGNRPERPIPGNGWGSARG